MTQKSRSNKGYYPSTQSNSFYRPPYHKNQSNHTDKEPAPKTEADTPKQVWYKNLSNADRVALIGIAVNALLAVFTYMLYTLSVGASNSAEISANAAKKSADLQGVAWDSAKIAKKQSDIAEAQKLKRDTEFVNKQKDGIDAQIGAIKETQNEFKIGNEPYIQIISPTISGVAKDTKIAVRINITNLGNYPIKMVYMKNLIGMQDSTYELKFTSDKTFNVNTYLIKGDPFPLDVFDHRVLTQTQVTEIANGKRYVYLSGFIKYQNLISKEFKLYKYMFKFNSTKLIEVIKNDNEPTK